MPLPKYKMSRANTRTRKATWKRGLKAPDLTECPQCHQPKLAYRVCMKCGYYKGKNVIAMKVEG